MTVIEFYGNKVREEMEMEKNGGTTMLDHDYMRNKNKDREDALNEQIDAEVNDLRILVSRQLACFHGEGENPGWNRMAVLRAEATDLIKKFL